MGLAPRPAGTPRKWKRCYAATSSCPGSSTNVWQRAGPLGSGTGWHAAPARHHQLPDPHALRRPDGTLDLKSKEGPNDPPKGFALVQTAAPRSGYPYHFRSLGRTGRQVKVGYPWPGHRLRMGQPHDPDGRGQRREAPVQVPPLTTVRAVIPAAGVVALNTPPRR